MSLLPRCLHFRGRMRRRPFIIWAVFFHAVLFVISDECGFLYGEASGADLTPSGQALVQALLALALVLNYCVHIQRLHDAGRNGWWSAPLAFLSIVPTVLFAILPTERRDNRHGPDIAANSRFWNCP